MRRADFQKNLGKRCTLAQARKGRLEPTFWIDRTVVGELPAVLLAGGAFAPSKVLAFGQNLGAGGIYFRRAFETQNERTSLRMSFCFGRSVIIGLETLRKKPNRSPAQRARFGKEPRQNE